METLDTDGKPALLNILPVLVVNCRDYLNDPKLQLASAMSDGSTATGMAKHSALLEQGLTEGVLRSLVIALTPL